MIETQTTYTDSGFDCDHCGGRVLRRIESATGRPDSQCYECETCSCQWTLENQPLSIGTLTKCQTAQKKRAIAGATDLDQYSRWILLGFVGLAVLFIFRFAGSFFFEYLLPIVVITALAYLGIRYLRQMNR